MILKDNLIYLRDLQESDFNDFYKWYSNEQVTRFLGMNPLSRDGAWSMFNQSLNDPNGVYFGIVLKHANHLIGYIFLSHILRSHSVAREFGIVLGDPNVWGQGYGSRATKLMLEYGFKHLNLHRIELLVLAFNKRALRMYRNLGFVEEGVQREARLIDNVWNDIVSMSILEQEYCK